MNQTMIWLGIAVLCFLLEFIVPGAVLSFVGFAAATVALGVYLGWIEGLTVEIMTFFVSSIFLLLVVRSLILRFLPGDSRVDNVDEDEQSKGALVEVILDISPSKRGRVRFRQSTWEAESEEYIPKGEKALIISRSGQCWIVQSLSKGNHLS